jgi:beta-N-acetylhexosaminidase
MLAADGSAHLIELAAATAIAAAGMTPHELAGQRVVYALPGTKAPAPLLRRIRRGEAAGVILFARNVRSRRQVRTLTRRLQAARPPRAPRLIVAIDQEGGLVKRLPGAPAHSAAELGRRGSARLARREGVATGRNLRGVGVNVDLAPVLDVGRRGSSVRSLGRTYSGRPGKVVRIGGAFAAGLSSARVVPTGKHFPGLGAARGDQDRVVNTIRLSLRRLRGVDELPYRRLGARLPMVMVSSAVYPALDPRRPALFSRRVATRELRGVAGFGGVSITDDLQVPSMSEYGAPGRRARAAARAGVDLLLFAQTGSGGAAAKDALARSIAAGSLDRAASERSVARVLALRAKLG